MRIRQDTVVAIVFVAAMFMNIMDATIVNTALPSIARDFRASITSVDWVVIGYLLSLSLWIPAAGWLGDRIGTRTVFLASLAIFTTASALAGLSQSLGQLVAFRILQGIGGGILTPVGQAMLYRAFPPEKRARASAILLVPTVLAPATGPVIGGLLVDQLSWRWCFYVNVPLGVLALVFGLLFLHQHQEPRIGGFDWMGFLLSGFGLALFVYALSEGATDGWGSPVILAPGLLGLILLAIMVQVELRRAHPMISLSLLRHRLFRTTNLVSLFGSAAFMGVLFAMPQFLQEARGASALSSGLTTFPEAVGVILSSRLVARLYPKIGPRRLMFGGLLGVTGAILCLATIHLGTSQWWIRLFMFLVGAGMAYQILPLQAASFSEISSADTGRASSLFNTQRQIAGTLGVSVLATVIAASLSIHPGAAPHIVVDAYRHAFMAAAVLAAAAAGIALQVHDEDAYATMGRQPVEKRSSSA